MQDPGQGRVHKAIYGDEAQVHKAVYGDEAQPKFPNINSHQQFQAVVDENVEYDRDDSVGVNHQNEGQRVPVYFPQVRL